ncbi:GPI transamidase component PIG-S isoform X1 [Bombus terrestris]|uniref:GPI transamidase component PIG-S isoform X1 n=1 Tax=Bombus terrestris TaxID=30195 RepID=A0A6P3UDZ0_BOMTE|nr:GPI transamidase component PIG-S isoform X1 [Bombus terrestris]XP_012173294.1 GPI transamidase component PIG-S isoform X1 [Bombus terrestris]
MSGSEVSVTIGYDTAVDEKYSVYASISFAVLLLGVGVPLWWHTTAIPRVSLPYAGIEALSDLDINIKTKIVVVALSRDRAESLVHHITNAFKNSNICRIEVIYHVISSNLIASAFTHHELEKIASAFNLDVGQLLLLETNNLNDAVLVGSRRTIYFSTETTAFTLIQVLSEWMLLEKSLTLTRNALTEPTLYSLDEENRRRFPASPAYDVLITVVNPDPEKLKIAWDLRLMAEEYVEPFLSELSILSNFSVKSQWLYLLPLDVSPKRVPDSGPLGRHFALSEDVLPQLITPLEKKLASQVSLHPTINFVIYAVPCDSAPLHIYTRSGHRSRNNANVEAFLSPRWGGVVLINPPVEACMAAKLDQPVTIIPEQITIVGTFLTQLKLLLGIPEPKFLNGVTAVSLPGLKLHDWEVDALLRVRTIEQLTSAKLTLQSIAQLLQEIGNIVITDIVGNRIKTALRLVEDSAEQLRRGNLAVGFLLSKEAFVTAEAAFFDPTLFALLYFPEDQKYAVYTPLFLPAMVPVLLSLKNIYRYYFHRRINNPLKETAPSQNK